MSGQQFQFGNQNAFGAIGDFASKLVSGRIKKREDQNTEIYNRATKIHDEWMSHALQTGTNLEARTVDRANTFKELHKARRTFTGNINYSATADGGMDISSTYREPAPKVKRPGNRGGSRGTVDLGPIIPADPGQRPGHVVKTDGGFAANPAYKSWKSRSTRRAAAQQQAAGNPHRF
jgi:hypothetical protein